MDALASDGSTIAGDKARDVAAANGIDRTVDGPLGGAIDHTYASTMFGSKDQHAYDVTAQNLIGSGYFKVDPSDTAGMVACAATRKCFIPVGVDWRKGSAFNAQRVLAVIDDVLTATKTDRVDILAHSQGGLITNALIHRPESSGKIYRVVTFGTPWLGAPKLLAALLYAEPCFAELDLGGCALDQQVIQELIKNYPGAAELNPSRAYYDPTAYSPLLHVVNNRPSSLTYDQAHQLVSSVMASSPLSRDMSLLDQAAAFHAAVDSWGPVDASVQLVRAIGYDATDSDTQCASAPCGVAGAGKFTRGTGTIAAVDVDTRNVYYGTGDGTVPLNSANVYNPATGLDDRSGAHDLYFCGVSHKGLAQSAVVWQYVGPFLDGSADYTNDDVKLGCSDSTDGTLSGVDLGGAPSSMATSPTASSSQPSVMQGALLRVQGAGYGPSTVVTVKAHSSTTVLGTVTTDSTGRFSAVFGLPMAVSPGRHDILADGVDAQGIAREQTAPVSVAAFGDGLGTVSSISGTAYDAASGERQSGICVAAFPAPSVALASTTHTDAHGGFRIENLNPGRYRVKFSDCGNHGYRTEWYSPRSSSSDDSVIQLAPGGERAQIDQGLTTIGNQHDRQAVCGPDDGACFGDGGLR